MVNFMGIIFKHIPAAGESDSEVEIYWNDEFIASWATPQNFPVKNHSVLAEMMKEVWLHGKRSGVNQMRKDLKDLLGIVLDNAKKLACE